MRWLLRLFAMLLLALLLVAWMRSYRFAEGIEVITPSGSFLLSNDPGRVRICWPSRLWLTPPATGFNASSSPRVGHEWDDEWKTDGGTPWHAIFARGTATVVGRQIRFTDISFWAMTLLAGIYPALVVSARIRKWWRLRSGAFCRICEYDLRGISDRCPECGTSVHPLPFRRRWGPRFVIGGIVACLFLGGGWLTLHDFRSTQCRNMDFATLGDFIFDQDLGTLADIPFPIRQLDGQRVAIEGYMIPMDQAENIREFALLPQELGEMGRPYVTIQQQIVARIVTGKPTGYIPERIRLTGTLHVHVTHDDGFLITVFEMTVDSIQPPAGEPSRSPSR